MDQKVSENKVEISSYDIASIYRKQHNHVLRDIGKLLTKNPKLAGRVFSLSHYIDNKKRKQPLYLMDKEGFSILTQSYRSYRNSPYTAICLKRIEQVEAEVDDSTEPEQEEVPAPVVDREDTPLFDKETQVIDTSAEVIKVIPADDPTVESEATTDKPEAKIVDDQASKKIPVLTEVDHQPMALSIDVANYFGKQHKHVIRDIEKILDRLPKETSPKFGLCYKNNELASGKPQKMYQMNRDGFMLLVMGWTGDKAFELKVAWLDAFNAMEAKLRQLATAALPSPTITLAQQREIQVAVAQRSGSERLLYQALYRELKNHFHVPSYKDIPAHCFAEAMELIDSVDLEGVVADARAASAPSQSPFDKMFTLMERETDTLEKLIEMRTETLKWLISMHQPTPTAQPQLPREPVQEPVKKEVPPAPQTVDPVPAEDEFVLEPQYAEKKTEHMSMALRPSLAQKFKQFASSKGLSMNEAINRALESFVQAPA